MKKIISLILVCILLLGCAFAITSCGKDDKDDEKKEATPNKDYKNAAEALKEAGYEVQAFGEGELGYMEEEGYSAIVNATKDNDMISIVYCVDSKTAEAMYNEAKDALEAMNQDAPEGVTYVVGKSGKMVWIGTKAAIKAAK